ncbi:MAG TPA: carboxypeptidase regulatory-like domain-containing protein, partial [Saprospiraceae bacterium]|nr:carboxypeptidase regulatory-like domain-containing protein [Saprospiraceae bacterium]
PGDTLWWSAYVRNAGDLLPSTQSQILYVELLDPRGSVLQQRTVLALGGTAVGEFDLDGNLPGGLYKIRARTAWMRNTDQAFERDITLQKTVLPRLNLRLEWERKAVGPGEVAIARFDAHSLSSQPLAQRNFRYTAAAAGQQFLEKTATTDAAGRAYIRFEMPKKLDSPDGLLNIMIEHEGQTEAISRPIPIVLNRIDLQFFPEGGDAVAGLPCRMGFKALNEHGKPADVSGIVADSRGQKVASFSSWHDGMGAFDFQPQPGERYTAYLEEPAAAARAYDMPDARSQGFALRLREHTPGSLGFELNATRPGKVYLVATSRDKVFYFNEIMLQDSPMASGSKTSGSITRTLSIPTHDLPIGIARFTLLDEKKTEVAERLVFLHRDRGLRFDIQTDKPRYLPRETVRMRIRATDHAGRPVQGQFSMGITDEPLLNYADDKQGHLLSALLLEQDLSGPVEEPNFYFDLKEPKAQQALDYLLLTQGWRRFAWKEVLNPAPLAYTNQPERATVAGRLCHPQTGLPLAGHTLRLNPDGASVKTDSAGRFVFADVDLLSHRHIRDQQEKLHEIVDFSQNMSLREGFAEGRQEWYYTSASTHPQGSTVLVGKVNEASVQEELIGATIKVMQGKNLVRGGITDYKGDYSMLLAPGIYDLEISYTGFTPTRISGVRVQQGRINVCNAEMSAGTVLEEVTVRSYKVPLIQQDQTSSGQTISATMGGMGIRDANGRVARAMDDMPGRPRKEAKRAKAEEKPAPLTSEQIRQMPTRTVQAIQAAPAGATAADDGQARVRGSRSKATQYYIDGVRVAGAPSEAAAQKDVRMGNTEAELASRDDLTMDEVVVLGRTQQDIARETGAISTIRFDAPNARNRRRDKEGADMMKAARAPQPSSPSRPPVRQYVRARQFYVPKYSGPVSQRTDFRPTIYWNPDLRTDAEGRATVEFVASDAITNFRATLEGISASGLPGHAEQQFFVEKPISVSTKVPPSVIAGDTLRLQVLLSNKT